MSKNNHPTKIPGKDRARIRTKYFEDERREIGRQIYDHEINKEEAAVKYKISPYTARDYYRLYKAELKFHEHMTAGR